MPRIGKNEANARIGDRLKRLRLKSGLSQQALADGIGVTFQQVQKYEKGTNEISSGRRKALAAFLKVPESFFYGESEQGAYELPELMSRLQSELFRLTRNVEGPELGEQIIAVVKALVGVHEKLKGQKLKE